MVKSRKDKKSGKSSKFRGKSQKNIKVGRKSVRRKMKGGIWWGSIINGWRRNPKQKQYIIENFDPDKDGTFKTFLSETLELDTSLARALASVRRRFAPSS